MNFSVRPCDDFYQFACGRFDKTSIIPEDSGSVNTINLIEGRVMAQLNSILNSEVASDDIRPFKMAKQMYRLCLNTCKWDFIFIWRNLSKPLIANIEKNGLDFVKKKLNLTSKWPVLMEEDEWDETVWNPNEFFRFTVDFFIDTDLKNTSRRALYASSHGFFIPSKITYWQYPQISAANLGLSRDMLLRGFQDKIMKAYHRCKSMLWMNLSYLFILNEVDKEIVVF